MLKLEEKQGYKFVEEFGYIPEDWNIRAFSETFTKYSTNSFTREEMSDIDGYVKNIHYGDILVKYGAVLDCSVAQIPYINRPIDESFKRVSNGDVVLADTAEDETVGKCVELYNISDNDTIFAGMHTMHLKPNFKFAPKYLGYFLNSNAYHNQLMQYITGIKVSSISKMDINKTSILIPPVSEQEKIAEVLSDIDELIESTQKLIDKKRDFKTATMQMLLTPKPHWSKETLYKCAYVFIGLVTTMTTNYVGSGVPLIRNSDIKANKINIDNLINLDIKFANNYNNRKLKIGDIVTVHTGDIGTSAIINKELEGAIGFATLNTRVDKTKLLPQYLCWYFNSETFQTKCIMASTGDGRQNLNLYDFIDFKIPIPPLLEQKQIAQVLSNIDFEIKALEKELNKYKDLKTGMMQKLLTGEIRLINNLSKNKNSDVVQIDTTANKQNANNEFKDAVLISMLAYKFGSHKYPLGAFRRQKLSYLFKRHNNLPINEYEKKAMGPYNPKIKYRGGEGIAIRNKYVKKIGERGLISDRAILKAEEYFNKYYSQESLSWLENNFKFTKNEDLEVLATVDYAIIELRNQNEPITLENIKSYIDSDEEWKPKLQKDFFNDNAIIRAMNISKTLLNSY